MRELRATTLMAVVGSFAAMSLTVNVVALALGLGHGWRLLFILAGAALASFALTNWWMPRLARREHMRRILDMRGGRPFTDDELATARRVLGARTEEKA